MNGRRRIGSASLAAFGLVALATAGGCGSSAPEERVDGQSATARTGDGSAAAEAPARAADEVVECGRAFNAAETRRYFGGKRRRGGLELGPLTVQGDDRVLIDWAAFRERQPQRRPWLLVKRGVLIRPPVEVTLEVGASGRAGLLLAFGRSDGLDYTQRWHRPSAGRATVTFEACDRAGPDGARPSRRSSVQHVGAFLVRRPGCYRLRASTPDEPGWEEGVMRVGTPPSRCGGPGGP